MMPGVTDLKRLMRTHRSCSNSRGEEPWKHGRDPGSFWPRCYPRRFRGSRRIGEGLGWERAPNVRGKGKKTWVRQYHGRPSWVHSTSWKMPWLPFLPKIATMEPQELLTDKKTLFKVSCNRWLKTTEDWLILRTSFSVQSEKSHCSPDTWRG